MLNNAYDNDNNENTNKIKEISSTINFYKIDIKNKSKNFKYEESKEDHDDEGNDIFEGIENKFFLADEYLKKLLEKIIKDIEEYFRKIFEDRARKFCKEYREKKYKEIEFLKLDLEQKNELNNNRNKNTIEEKYKQLQEKIKNLENENNKLKEQIKNKDEIINKLIDTYEPKNKNEKSEENDGKIFKCPKGLVNIGLTCYMNSLLQCLFYIPELRQFFINEQFTEKQEACQALSEVMKSLNNKKSKKIKPEKFKEIMGKKNKLFSGIKAGDAKDLLFNVIDILLLELTQDEDDNENYDNESLPNEGKSNEKINNITDQNKLFQLCKSETNENLIINKLFIGYYEQIYNCSKIKNKKIYSFQSESFILFELQKIKNYFGDKKLNLELCFSYLYRKRKNSSFFCSECNSIENSDCHEVIYRPPKILVIILDRGKGKTFKEQVVFHPYLDLVNCISEENYDYSSLYQLIGVITHSGKSSSSGHYTARCLTDKGEYYYFSDEQVIQIEYDEGLLDNEPYILFYKMVNKNEIKENMEKINDKIDKINPKKNLLIEENKEDEKEEEEEEEEEKEFKED